MNFHLSLVLGSEDGPIPTFWLLLQAKSETRSPDPLKVDLGWLLIYPSLFGCFCKGGVFFAGVLTMRRPLFGVYIKAPDYWNLSFWF